MAMKLTCAIDEIKTLTPGEVRAALDGDRGGDYLLLDVRQPEEYDAGHLPGAMLIPLGELEARQEELERGKNIITYCRSGRRSMAAAIELCGLGFEHLYNLEGGILNWGYETIAGAPEERPVPLTVEANTRDILVLALKLEKGSRDFYAAAGEGAVSPQTRDTLLFLARAEEAHMERLRERAAALPNKEALPDIESLPVTHMEGGIEVSVALARAEGFSDEMEALEMALEKEYMSYDLYKRASNLVEDSDAKALLYELSLEERNHADILLRRLAEVVR